MGNAAIKNVSADLADIEKKVGLDAGFVAGLIDEKEDWAFVVKINVVLEAALNAVLAEISPGHNLTDFVGQLALQGRSGKLSMGKAAGLIDGEEAEAFSALAAIRNRFVHSLSGLAGTLNDYAKRMSPQERVDFARKTFHLGANEVEEFRKETVEEFAAHFRERIWWCAASLLMALCIGDHRNAVREAKFKLAEFYRPEPAGLGSLGDLFTKS